MHQESSRVIGISGFVNGLVRQLLTATLCDGTASDETQADEHTPQGHREHLW